METPVLSEATLKDSNNFSWVIESITDANDETKELFVERNRVGQVVKPVYGLDVGYPLHLVYVQGEKSGGYLQHSMIVKVERLENSVIKVYTRNTMYRLRLNVV